MSYLAEKRQAARPTAKTPGQQNYLDILNSYQYKIVVTLGPAGTGKTMLATERAIERLQKGEIDRVVVTRPASSVDEEIGFLPGDINKWDLHMLHWTAWEKGVKSLYYCRSKSIQRASYAGAADKTDAEASMMDAARTDYEECLACQ